MIPMITSVTEVQAVKKIINGICRDLDKKDIKYDKDIKIGVMIETPAAAIMADVLGGICSLKDRITNLLPPMSSFPFRRFCTKQRRLSRMQYLI